MPAQAADMRVAARCFSVQRLSAARTRRRACRYERPFACCRQVPYDALPRLTVRECCAMRSMLCYRPRMPPACALRLRFFGVARFEFLSLLSRVQFEAFYEVDKRFAPLICAAACAGW